MLHNIYANIDSSGGFGMPVFNLQVAPDYLLRYSKTQPIDAVKELIWNALDADATEILVELERNITGKIKTIYVEDNGHGINYQKVESTFGNLGNSEKLYMDRTPRGRFYHGKNGEGRYKALSLGQRLTWESHYENTDGIISLFLIKCHGDNPHEIDCTEPAASVTALSTGVRVVVEGISDKTSDLINNDEGLIDEFVAEFAPYLLGYPGITIMVNGTAINPEEFIADQVVSDFSIDLEKRTVKGIMRLICWKNGNYNRLHMCSKEGVSFSNGPLQIYHGDLPIAVYVQSDYIKELNDSGILDFEDAAPGLREIRSRARDMVKDYYNEWLRVSAANTIEEFRKDGVYPYQGDPKDALDIAERKVFDICAITMQRQLPEFPKTPKKQKKLMLNLIKEALQQRPSGLHRIFQEVLELSDEQIKDFSDILQKTSLNAMISTTKMVSDRLKFLNGLDQIIYEPELSKKLKERSQLHKILLNELWIFGEHFTYGCDDVKLYNVLKEYVGFLGRSELAQDLSREEIKQLGDIPDLCLWNQYGIGRPDEVENLVVELKRPSVKIGQGEINQITQYARKVAENPRFPKDKTRWVFLIVGSELDDNAKFIMEEKKDHCYLERGNGNVAVYVKDWGQVINEANARHKYLEESLKLAVTDNKEGMDYLLEKYSQLMPNVQHEIEA
jgi:hypothetical protein